MLKAFEQGNHICALYGTEEEQLATAVPFVADGLRRGEQCLYVGASPLALERFRRALDDAGVDAAGMVARGALLAVTHAEAHLLGGSFDSERMLRSLNDAVESALNAGFSGLRTCGDMSWLLEEAAGSESVVEYEALLNEFFRGVRGLGMCLYDRRRLPPALVDHALATHWSVCVGGRHKANPFYEPASVSRWRTPQIDQLPSKLDRLWGE